MPAIPWCQPPIAGCLSAIIMSPLNSNVKMSPMRLETFTLSQKELQRVEVISQCAQGNLACTRAASCSTLRHGM